MGLASFHSSGPMTPSMVGGVLHAADATDLGKASARTAAWTTSRATATARVRYGMTASSSEQGLQSESHTKLLLRRQVIPLLVHLDSVKALPGRDVQRPGLRSATEADVGRQLR